MPFPNVLLPASGEPKCTELELDLNLNASLSGLGLPLDAATTSSTSPTPSSVSSSTTDLSPRSLTVSPHKPPHLTLPPQPPPALGRSALHDGVLRCVVKLHVTHCEPKYIRPWQMGAQTYTTASGFVLPGRRILTNAHAVEHHTLVRVKRRDNDKRYLARVLAQSDECDLALLTVSDEAFWTGVDDGEEEADCLTNLTTTRTLTQTSKDGPAAQVTDNMSGTHGSLALGDSVPALRDSVVVIGYPHGGDGISVTAGVVSRVELLDYSAAASLLSVQIDAAVNPGNSGGPALDAQGNVVGVAFRAMTGTSSENIGYLIPVPVVRHFLDDVERHGRYTGFPSLGFDWLDLEAPAMRRHLGLPASESGVLVRDVPPTSPARGVLRQGDIVTHVNDTPVSNAGMVRHAASHERMALHIVIADKFIGDDVTLRVFRRPSMTTSETDNETVPSNDTIKDSENSTKSDKDKNLTAEDKRSFTNVTYKLPDLNETRLIPVHLPPRYSPPYFVFGGLVFTTLTGPYLRSSYGFGPMAESRTPTQIRWLWEFGTKREDDEEIVILSHVLNAQLNIHYEHLYDERVHRVNGTAVRNLKHLTQLVTQGTGEFVVVDLLEEMVVLDREEAVEAHQEILDMHHIAKGCSFDMDEVKKYRCSTTVGSKMDSDAVEDIDRGKDGDGETKK